MSYVSKNPKFNDVIFKDNGLAGSVANPASGSDKIVNRGGNFFSRSSTGAEKPLGGGGGEVNVFTDTDGIGATWVASGAGVTVANTTTTSEIALYPTKTTAIKVTNVSGTDYMRGRFTMPAGLKNVKLKIQFFQQALSGYVSGDMKLEIYTNTASNYGGTYVKLPLSTDVSGVTSLANATEKFTTYFDSESLNYYEVRVVRVNGTSAMTFGGIIVGPGIQPASAAVTDWQEYTPTISASFGTTSNVSFKYRRVGSSVQIEGSFVAGTVTGSQGTISIPSGLTPNVLLPANKALGLFFAQGGGATNPLGSVNNGVIFTDGTDYIFTNSQNASGGNQFTAVGVSNFAANGSVITVKNLDVPVAEWSGNGVLQLAENAVEFASNSGTWDADDSTSFAYGPAGQPIGGTLTATRNKRVKFQSPILDGDIVVVEGSSDGTQWYEINQTLLNSLHVIRGVTNGGSFISGVSWYQNSADEVEVIFGQYIAISNNDTITTDWPSTNAFWRVRKISQNAALGFADASENAAGLAGPTGEYAITASNTTNVASSSFTVARFTKVGKEVTVYFNGSLTTSGAALTLFTLNLPYATTMSASTDCAGVCTWFSGGGAIGAGQIVNSINTEASVQFYASSASSGVVSGSFSYVIK